MTKKYLFVGMAAILGASLSFFACESATDGAAGAAGAAGVATLPAGATPALLEAYFESAGTVFMVDTPATTGTFKVPRGKTLAVVGTVDLSSNEIIINAFDGTLDVSRGDFTGSAATFVVNPEQTAEVAAKVSGGIKIPAYVAGVDPETPISDDAVLTSLSLGGSGVSAANLATFAAGNTVYVTGALTIDATEAVDTDSAKLVALGETAAAGAGGITFGANTVIGTLKATGALTITAVGAGGVESLDLNGQTVTITAVDNIDAITNGATAATIALGAGSALPEVKVGAGNVTVTTSATALTVADLSTGAGKLVIPAAAITFTATAGGGNFEYAAAPAGDANLSFTSADGLTYTGGLTTSGTVSFAGDLTVTGDASFGATTDATASGGATITFNGSTAALASYTAKATTNATAFAGSAALTIATLTDISSASTVTFNSTGGTTITAAVTTDTSGLTIGGTGAVTLTAAPVITNGLTVTNTTGVTMPSVTGVASQSINASAGKVIFGTADNNVTIVNGTLTSAANGLASAAVNGAITLAYSSNGASLTLANEGRLTVTGDGSVTAAGSLKIEGDGTTLSSAGISAITADDGSATLTTAAAANGGVQIGTAADGVALLAVGADAMTYTFTKSAGDAPVSINGEYITVPADGATGAIFAATTADKAKIVLGATSGGFKIGQGDHGGKFAIVHSAGGSKIGPFAAGSHANGNLPASVGLAATDEQSDGAKILLGAYGDGFSTTGAAVTAFGTTGSGEAAIDSSVVLVSTG